MLLKFLVAMATAYIGFALIVTVAQGRLLYPAPGSIAPPMGGFDEIAYETEDGLTLRAGYRAAEPGFPTIVYFHGNGADWVSSVVATDRLVPAGYGVLAAEYRGYRGNPGSPSEQGLYRDGRAAMDFLAARGVADTELVLIGNSIGSGVATQLASERNVRALVLISPFASLRELVAEKLRILPTSLLLRDRYENADKLPAVTAPVLILHGTADTLIPHAHALRLAQRREDVEVTLFDGKGHDLAWHDEAEHAVLTFLERLQGAGISASPSM